MISTFLNIIDAAYTAYTAYEWASEKIKGASSFSTSPKLPDFSFLSNVSRNNPNTSVLTYGSTARSASHTSEPNESSNLQLSKYVAVAISLIGIGFLATRWGGSLTQQTKESLISLPDGPKRLIKEILNLEENPADYLGFLATYRPIIHIWRIPLANYLNQTTRASATTVMKATRALATCNNLRVRHLYAELDANTHVAADICFRHLSNNRVRFVAQAYNPAGNFIEEICKLASACINNNKQRTVIAVMDRDDPQYSHVALALREYGISTFSPDQLHDLNVYEFLMTIHQTFQKLAVPKFRNK